MGAPEGSNNRKVNCTPPGVPFGQVSVVSGGPFREKLNKSGLGVGASVNLPPVPACYHNIGGADVLPGANCRLRPANASGQPPDAKMMDPFRPHHSPISNLLDLFCQRTDRDAEANDVENQSNCRVKDANAASGH